MGYAKDVDIQCKILNLAALVNTAMLSQFESVPPPTVNILMGNACDKHDPFEDVLSNHPAFSTKWKTVALGRDFRCVGDDTVHNHGVNSIRSGRGALLIVDLTNRCNMVCSPCFMDANASTYVHELTMDGVKQILDRAASFKPRREINVAFTGGEATLSPSSSMGMEDGEISFCAYNGGGWRKLVEQNTGRKLGIRSILSVPSHRKKEFIGIIQVSLIRPHAFNVADIGKLRHTGDRLLESI